MRTLRLTRIDAWRDKPPSYPHPLHRWLTDRGSLTARLTAHFPDFRLYRLAQGSAYPNRDELRHLGIRHGQTAVVREVLLQSAETPLVFAHSVTATCHLNGAWRGLSRLGSHPLAEMLFHDPTLVRLPMEYRKIDRRHTLYRSAMEHAAYAAPSLWARRSIFLKDAMPLLVTEVFLPSMSGR